MIGCIGHDLVVFGVFSVFLGVSAVSIFNVGVVRVLNFASVSASPAQLYMLLSERELLRIVSLVAPEMYYVVCNLCILMLYVRFVAIGTTGFIGHTLLYKACAC